MLQSREVCHAKQEKSGVEEFDENAFISEWMSPVKKLSLGCLLIYI